MGVKLTKRVVDSAMPGERDAFLWDTDLKGFILKVTPKGRKVFLVERRVGAGRAAKLRRVTIGTYGIFTVDQARGKAEEILRALKAGSDPVAERRVLTGVQI